MRRQNDSVRFHKSEIEEVRVGRSTHAVQEVFRFFELLATATQADIWQMDLGTATAAAALMEAKRERIARSFVRRSGLGRKRTYGLKLP
jgi:hypothetical protein